MLSFSVFNKTIKTKKIIKGLKRKHSWQRARVISELNLYIKHFAQSKTK